MSFYSYEYSYTSIEQQDDGTKLVHFQPFTHKGNVMRYYESTFPDGVPTRSFNTSFPALLGASGAPVVRATDFVVVGMLVRNFGRHLHPAQVERIEEPDGTSEEVSYFLPLGTAISSGVIADYLESAGADPEIVQEGARP